MKTSRCRSAALLVAATLLAPMSLTATAQAKSWCAQPLVVHEWGVQVFNNGRVLPPLPLPDYFHTSGPTVTAKPAVWTLPPDSGVRTIPVVQFFADSREVPVALSVGFSEGAATVWYPQVDVLRSATVANGPPGAQARARVEAFRAAQRPYRGEPARGVPDDFSRQLEWQRLTLTGARRMTSLAPAQQPWVQALRELPGALWVQGAETERFVFYEGKTAESQALVVERGPTWADGRRHLLLKNSSAHAAHDVFFVHREDGHRYVFFAPQIPAGAYAGFIVEDHRADDAAAFKAATIGRLKKRLTAPPLAAPYSDRSACVMGRQPAVPVEAATDHRVFKGEIDVLIDLWAPRFFEAAGTTVVYREDTGYLDAVMPLSVYTDMRHYVTLSRLGMALWEQVALP